MDTPVNSSTSAAGGAAPVLVAVYWLIVGIPLGWGVFQTVQKSIPLFRVTSAPAAAAAPADAAATPAK